MYLPDGVSTTNTHCYTEGTDNVLATVGDGSRPKENLLQCAEGKVIYLEFNIRLVRVNGYISGYDSDFIKAVGTPQLLELGGSYFALYLKYKVINM